MKNLHSGLIQPQKLKNIFISVHDGAVTCLIVMVMVENIKKILKKCTVQKHCFSPHTKVSLITVVKMIVTLNRLFETLPPVTTGSSEHIGNRLGIFLRQT